MSKVTLNNITGGYAAVDLLNENFDAIEAAFENTLSRNGAVPNPMLADFDLNHKDILNGGEINAQLLVLNGQPVTPGTLNYNGVVKETQTATASQTVFNLTTITYSPLVNNLSVYVDGVYQNPSRYTETSATRVTFSEGLHLGAVVDFVVLSLNELSGTTSASNITINDAGNYYSSNTVEGALQEAASFTQSGTGASTISTQNKLRQTISVDDFIPAGTDITTANCTAYVQAAINEAASKGVWLTGNNKTYLVSTVNMLTGQRVRDVGLNSIGPLSAGAVSMQPVVWINGVSSVKTDMIFDNVRVNGRRQLFTSIDLTGGGQGEDGGMHCWRVSGGESGGVSNITWINCEGTYGGTAGLAIHCNDPSTSTATYKIKNLKWVGGKLTYNREHGFFADSFDGLQVIDCDCSYNGIDLNTSDSLDHGNRGARVGGKLFGTSFDLETYTGYNGSLWTRFYARNLNCTNSAMPSLLYNPIATNVAGYVQPKDIKISDCTFDKGSATGSDRAANTDYSFYVLGSYTSYGYPYVGIAMNNNRFLQAAPQFNGVTELSVTGGYIESSTYKAHVYNCFGWDVSANGLSNKIDLYPTVSFTFTKTQGTAGAAISANTTEYVSSKTGGNDMYRVSLTITGSLSAGGDLIYTTVSPISGRYITEAYVSGKSISGTKAIITSSEVDPVSGVAAFNFSTVNNDNIYAELYIVLASSA